MTKPEPHTQKHKGENVLNTKDLTADRPSEQVQVLTVSFSKLMLTVLDVCVCVCVCVC